MQTMFIEMSETSFNNNIDVDFIKEMIPHHAGAIAMSKTTLKYDICPELRPILEAIIISQSKGIQELETLLSSLTIENHNCE